MTQVVPARSPKPILQCVKIVAAGKQIELYATDLELAVSYVVTEVEVKEPGQVVVPAAKLAAIVRESAEQVLTLTADETSCELVGVDSHFTIYCQPAEQFPAIPEFTQKTQLEIPLGRLQTAIKQSLFATAKESSRYALNGVLWEVKGKKMQLIATDGRRLVQVKAMLTAAEEAFGKTATIVPAKTMALVDKIAAEPQEPVQVAQVENQLLIKCANVVISSNLVDGSFPKYEDIIPTNYTNKVTLSTEATLSAVRRASLLASEDSLGIKVAIGPSKIVFSCRAPETGDSQIQMQADYSGEPVEIGFNPTFVSDVLKVIDDEQFVLEIDSADKPALLKAGKSLLYVIMPINLN